MSWNSSAFNAVAFNAAASGGETYTPAAVPIECRSYAPGGVVLAVTSQSVEVSAPSLAVESVSALPTFAPFVLVQSATRATGIEVSIAVTSSARHDAVHAGGGGGGGGGGGSGAGLSRTLMPWIEVGGVDLSARLSGPWTVTREEGRAAVGEFTLRQPAGPLDVNDAIRAPVRFGYRIDGGDPVLLFSGVVDEPAYDPQTRRMVYTCTDNLPRVIGALGRPQVDALTPGAYWSDAAYNADADAWQYAQDRMETLPASLDLSIDGGPRLHAWAAAATPHFTFRDDPATGNFVDQTLRLSQASWREFVNEITLTVEARYQRRVHRQIGYRWTYTPGFRGYLMDTSPLPTEDTIRSAAEQSGWSIRREWFTRLPPSGIYYDAVWVHDPDRAPYWVLEAQLTLARRWDEAISELATYTVRAPASISRFEAIREQDRITYAPDPPADTAEWLNRDLDQRQRSGLLSSQPADDDLEGFALAPGGVSYRDDLPPDGLAAASMVGLQRAVRRILDAHRQHTAEVTAPLLPEIDVIHTAEIIASGLTCRGKVREVIHSGDTDVAAAAPQTTIRIALSQCDADALVVSTPVAPVVSTVPAPDVSRDQPALVSRGGQVHLGNRWYSPPDNPDWTGWISNYARPEPVGATQYEERFVIDVGEYVREPIEVSNSATLDVAVPHDILSVTA